MVSPLNPPTPAFPSWPQEGRGGEQCGLAGLNQWNGTLGLLFYPSLPHSPSQPGSRLPASLSLVQNVGKLQLSSVYLRLTDFFPYVCLALFPPSQAGWEGEGTSFPLDPYDPVQVQEWAQGKHVAQDSMLLPQGGSIPNALLPGLTEAIAWTPGNYTSPSFMLSPHGSSMLGTESPGVKHNVNGAWRSMPSWAPLSHYPVALLPAKNCWVLTTETS